MSRKTGWSTEDYCLASLLELFNGIYEYSLEDRLPRITEQVDAIVKKNKEKVRYCYYELGGTPHWGEKIYFLGDHDTDSKEMPEKEFIEI